MIDVNDFTGTTALATDENGNQTFPQSILD